MAIKPKHDGKLINSLARGSTILRLLADADAAIGVTDIAEQLKVDPSTAYRLLVTLEASGLVQQVESKKYALGYGILEIAFALLRRLSVVTLADPYLRSIATLTGESTHVAVLDGPRAVFVGRQSGAGILRVETTIGSSEPAYCTAVGKALLADHTEVELRRLFAAQPMTRYTPQTITTIDGLASELERVRRNGYAYDEEELHPGVRCLAAPIRDHRSRIVAAFGLSMPATRLTRDHIPALVEHIAGAAENVSSQLGYVAEPTAKSS